MPASANTPKDRRDPRQDQRDDPREVRIGQEDVGRFAAQLLRDALDGGRGRLRDQHARAVRSGDRDHVDIGVRRHRRADFRTGAVDQIEDTGRHPGVVDDPREQQRAER